MAGIAIVVDLLRKNPNLSRTQTLHSNALFSAKVTASAAAASVAAATPFASRVLFGNGISVAYCDAGAIEADLGKEYLSNIRSASENIFFRDSLTYTTKEYRFELKSLFSAFGPKALAITSLRSFMLFYLPLLEPKLDLDEDDEVFLDAQEEHPVDLVAPFKKSVKQIIRETTVVTTRRVLERLAVHYVSQRMAWKLLKDVPKSAVRKAGRRMPILVYFVSVKKTTFRGHLLGVAASWLVQVGIDVYRCVSGMIKSEDEIEKVDKVEHVKVLGKRVSGATIRCFSSLVFASIGAGIGASLFRPSAGQWIGCAVGDFAGPIIVSFSFAKFLHLEI